MNGLSITSNRFIISFVLENGGFETIMMDMVLRKVKSARKCVTMIYIVVIVCAGMLVWIKKN